MQAFRVYASIALEKKLPHTGLLSLVSLGKMQPMSLNYLRDMEQLLLIGYFSFLFPLFGCLIFTINCVFRLKI